MDEYFGENMKAYAQTEVAVKLLNPAIRRILAGLKRPSAKLLDLACGQGVMYPIAREQGYEYTGIDISPDQIREAKKLYNPTSFVVGDARDYVSDTTYDVILASMVFPMLSSTKDMQMILQVCARSLNADGKVIIAVTHPCFDHYMRFGVLGQKNVKTDFAGYFASGTEFKIEHPMPNGTFVFDDFHWTLSDYVSAIVKSGFQIESTDECAPSEIHRSDEKFWKRRNAYPTYLVFVCSKHN